MASPDLMRKGSCDTSYQLGDRARFRVNVFAQRGHYSIVCRKLNTQIPTHDAEISGNLGQIPREKTAWSSSPARPRPVNPPRWRRSSTR